MLMTNSQPVDGESDPLQRWHSATQRGITLVTAGKPVEGKSALIKNLVGLEGENAPVSI